MSSKTKKTSIKQTENVEKKNTEYKTTKLEQYIEFNSTFGVALVWMSLAGVTSGLGMMGVSAILKKALNRKKNGK